MGEEFYAIIKLVSGEEILSLVMIDENEGDPVVVLQNPIIIKTLHTPQGGFIKVKPWVEMSDDDFFMIKLDKIITMTETKNKKLIEIFDNYNSDEEGGFEFGGSNVSSGQVKPSSKMGYVSSVEEARKKLENLFKGIKES